MPSRGARLRARLGVRKEVAVTGALSLEALLRAAHLEGTTLNGLLLAAVTEALRSQLRGRGGRDDVEVHALVPMSMPPGPDPSAGNRYASVFVPLPMALPDREARVKQLRESLTALRARGAASAGSSLASAAGAATAFVERAGVVLFSRRATVMVSDVRGPTEAVPARGRRRARSLRLGPRAREPPPCHLLDQLRGTRPGRRPGRCQGHRRSAADRCGDRAGAVAPVRG